MFTNGASLSHQVQNPESRPSIALSLFSLRLRSARLRISAWCWHGAAWSLGVNRAETRQYENEDNITRNNREHTVDTP